MDRSVRSVRRLKGMFARKLAIFMNFFSSIVKGQQNFCFNYVTDILTIFVGRIEKSSYILNGLKHK